MLKQHPGKWDRELGTLISLVMSLGMIVLAIAGWWLWKILAPIAPVLSSGVSSIEMP